MRKKVVWYLIAYIQDKVTPVNTSTVSLSQEKGSLVPYRVYVFISILIEPNENAILSYL